MKNYLTYNFGKGSMNKNFRKHLASFFLVFLFVFTLLSPQAFFLLENGGNVAMADPIVAPSTTGQEDATESQKGFGEIASMLVSLFTPMIAFMTTLSGSLLGNDWIYGTAGSPDGSMIAMENTLHEMWKIMRDLVNYVFIVILVVVAFMNVISAGSEFHSKFEIKTMLPKIIIALVVVNFTWFGAKIVLDTANVATHIVFGIPKTVADATSFGDKGTAYCIPESIIFKDGEKLDKVEYDMAIEALQNGECEMANEDNKWGVMEITWKTVDAKDTMSGHSLTSLLAFGVLHVEQLPMGVNVNGKSSIAKLGMDAMFALVFMIIILIVMASLVLVLLIRVILIWLNIILSPFFVLTPLLSDFGVSENDNWGMKAFIKQAFIPAMVAFPLVIGMSMIMVGKSYGETFINPDLGEALKSIQYSETGMFHGMNNIQELMWYVLVIVVMWSAVKVAEESSEFAGMIIKPASDMVKSGAKYIAKAPLFTPWIPVKTTEGKDGSAAIGDFMPLLADFKQDRYKDRDKRLKDNWNVGGSSVESLSKKTQDAFKEIKNMGGSKAKPEAQKMINGNYDKAGIIRSLNSGNFGEGGKRLAEEIHDGNVSLQDGMKHLFNTVGIEQGASGRENYLDDLSGAKSPDGGANKVRDVQIAEDITDIKNVKVMVGNTEKTYDLSSKYGWENMAASSGKSAEELAMQFASRMKETNFSQLELALKDDDIKKLIGEEGTKKAEDEMERRKEV